MPLVVELPGEWFNEQRYVAHCLLSEFLGLDFTTSRTAARAVRIHDGDGRNLEIAADLFARPPDACLSLPREPLAWWDASEIPGAAIDGRLPALYGRPSATLGEQSIRLGVDIFGTCFFFLARLEEAVDRRRDAHDRFAAAHSLSSRCGFLCRPIVDEYVEALWACLHALWPSLTRRRRTFRLNLTHDVDLPWFFLPRILASDINCRRFGRALSHIKQWWSITSGRATDPFDTFDLIMDASEAAGVTSAFYFITQWTDLRRDASYRFRHPRIRALLQRINARGHEIGLHASYGSYARPGQIAKEFAVLQRVCTEAGIRQEHWGGRQHYLRWRTPETVQYWEAAGLDYDSTLGYADAAGFRCGTCHEFPTFNLATGQMLRLRERPLIAMDCSVMDAPYQALGATAAAFDYLRALKDTCRHYDGVFTLLWHNNRLADPAESSLYHAVVSSAR